MKIQRVSNGPFVRMAVLLAAVLLLYSPEVVRAQDQQAIYTVVTFMKVKQGEDGRYVRMEKELAKPIHEELVKQGKILGWYMYRIEFTGTGDDYNYATVSHYLGRAAMENRFASDVVAQVHPDRKWDDLANEVNGCRELVTSRVLRWWMQSLPDPQEGREPAKYAVINYMKVPQGAAGEFYTLREQYIKPAFDMALKEGKVEGWGLWGMEFPAGEDMPFNFVSSDFYNTMEAVGSSGLGQYIQKAHPDEDPDAIWAKLSANRKMAYRELWRLIDYTR